MDVPEVLPETQTPQNPPHPFLQEHSVSSNQYNPGQADQFQYFPGQHWLAGPSYLVHGHESSKQIGGPEETHFGYSCDMTSSSMPRTHQQGHPPPPMYSSTSYSLSATAAQTNNNTHPYHHQHHGHGLNSGGGGGFPGQSCNYHHQHHGHGPNSGGGGGFLGQICHYHHQHPGNGPNSGGGGGFLGQSCHYHHHIGGGQIVMAPTPTPPAAVATTSTARAKIRKSSSVSAAVLLSRIPWRPSSEMLSYGGLSVLWRQVPEACQKIITSQDIPDTVKVRGYFTVSELLELKRSLMARLQCMDNTEPESQHILPHDHEEGVGVGGAVKEAMATLDESPAPQDGDDGLNRGFAFKTVGHRLPVILTKVIDQLSRDKNEIGNNLGMDARDEVKVVVGALAKLKNEMQTNKSMPKTNCPVWDGYMELMGQRYFEGKTEEIKWYLAPWLFVECYMYKRLNDALQSTKFLKDYDVFKKQKESGWLQSLDAACVLGKFIQSAQPNPSDTMLEEMLEISLWGNRCDLSISQGEDNSQTHNIVDQLQDLKKFILCDDASQFWQYLKDKRSETPVSVGYVLDNAGFELFTDLCFADSLMTKVDRIDFHVKTMPWFVSDALRQDFDWLIDSMINALDNPILVDFGTRWKGYLKDKKWTVIESGFWTYPHSFHEMSSVDSTLFSTLQRNTVLIFKGDLNYRKLIGDINWVPETPFKEALQGFWPSPLVALRTLKADCVAGLRPGLAKEIEAKNPEWMVTGEYGVIQFCGAS